jgi:hypothetical protein
MGVFDAEAVDLQKGTGKQTSGDNNGAFAEFCGFLGEIDFEFFDAFCVLGTTEGTEVSEKNMINVI